VVAFPIEERLKFGALSLEELVGLSGRCLSSIRTDIADGKLKVNKVGKGVRGRVLVPGPEAQRYLGLTGVRDA